MVGVIKPSERIRILKKRLVGSILLLVALGFCAKSIAVSTRATNNPQPTPDFPQRSLLVTNSSDFVVDILSVGSIFRSELQDAQEHTLATSPSVRNWVRLTEHDDFEQMCSSKMTARHIELLSKTCKQTIWLRKIAQNMRGELFTPRNHTGWLCAQKRPIEGLYKMLHRYRNNKELLPNYLMIIDDDTYVNTKKVIPLLKETFSTKDPQLLTGCVTYLPERQHVKYPTKGYGTILSSKAIQNLLRPIHCDASNESDLFSIYACWRLALNIMGEEAFFRDGMSLIDLMGAYSRGFEFSQVHAWKVRTGYCLTSDMALGYFLSFYFVGVPDAGFNKKGNVNDFTRKKYPFQDIAEGQCDSKCSPNSLICHGANAQQMNKLFKEQQAALLLNK